MIGAYEKIKPKTKFINNCFFGICGKKEVLEDWFYSKFYEFKLVYNKFYKI